MSSVPPIILVRSNFTRFGGAETFTLGLINSLLAYTDRNICLLTLPNQQWPIDHPRLKIVHLGISRGHRLWIVWCFNKMVLRYLKSHSAGAILSIDRIGRFTHLHAGGGSHRMFLRIQNRYSNWLQRYFRKLSIYHLFILHLERQGLSNPDLRKVICCSKMVAEQLREIYAIPRKNLHVCYNPIDWEGMGRTFMKRTELAYHLSKEFGIDPNVPWLLFLGSGFDRKGLDIAIKGLTYMPEKYHLMVVGSGNTYNYKRLAAKLGLSSRVCFLGPQPQGWRFASMCVALVHPARYEPFGLGVAEAQAMGLSVLVSNKTGYSEIVQHGQSGVILNLDSGAHNFQDAFLSLTLLIEKPCLTPEEIRETVKQLDNRTIMQALIQDCLKLTFRPGQENPPVYDSIPAF